MGVRMSAKIQMTIPCQGITPTWYAAIPAATVPLYLIPLFSNLFQLSLTNGAHELKVLAVNLTSLGNALDLKSLQFVAKESLFQLNLLILARVNASQHGMEFRMCRFGLTEEGELVCQLIQAFVI